jgi:hypothetical protein
MKRGSRRPPLSPGNSRMLLGRVTRSTRVHSSPGATRHRAVRTRSGFLSARGRTRGGALAVVVVVPLVVCFRCRSRRASPSRRVGFRSRLGAHVHVARSASGRTRGCAGVGSECGPQHEEQASDGQRSGSETLDHLHISVLLVSLVPRLRFGRVKLVQQSHCRQVAGAVSAPTGSRYARVAIQATPVTRNWGNTRR